MRVKKRMNNIRHTKGYRLAKERVRKLLKKDKVKSISGTSQISGKGSHITIHLRTGKPITYKGALATALYQFIWKKRYCKEEMDEKICHKY